MTLSCRCGRGLAPDCLRASGPERWIIWSQHFWYTGSTNGQWTDQFLKNRHASQQLLLCKWLCTLLLFSLFQLANQTCNVMIAYFTTIMCMYSIKKIVVLYNTRHTGTAQQSTMSMPWSITYSYLRTVLQLNWPSCQSCSCTCRGLLIFLTRTSSVYLQLFSVHVCEFSSNPPPWQIVFCSPIKEAILLGCKSGLHAPVPPQATVNPASGSSRSSASAVDQDCAAM